ncbi:hypothetical protein [Kitasatospora indigofera]|uniref:hypothetical protein n=1 Tax=Kitasatospora indigofera TaxID=67307 RepID=UPI00362E21B3
MEARGAWSAGPEVDAGAEGGGHLELLLRWAAARESHGRIVITPLVCRFCDWDRFEVAADECFCEGCCLPLGIADGDVYAGGFTWELAASAPPLPWLRRVFRKPADPACPAGHDVFQVAVAYALAADSQVCRLSVGLRCPVDGALSLYLDNVRVVPNRA